MAFTEQNTVEHFIIHQLTGVNLNAVRGNPARSGQVMVHKFKEIKDEDLFNRAYEYIKEYY